ncbi:MAG: hypothetical protein JWR16_2895 [Nevskia sp.]|nr:hypothetical protein [Nevskia sp.]
MLTVIQKDKLVYVVLAALALGFAAWALFTYLVLIALFQESWGWASVALGSISLTGIFLAALGHPRTVNWLWRKIPALNWWLAPNLNGEFQLETSSNWSIQKRMLDCIEGRDEQTNAAQDTNELLTVTGRLTIKLGLFGIEAHYLPDTQEASRSESFVVAAALESRRRDGCFWFHYVYEGRVPDPIVATDHDSYYGSASLRIARDSLDSLAGYYWTNRSWREGINTAGKAQLRRIAPQQAAG